MKKVVVLFSAILLFVGLTFGQNQSQTQDKGKAAPAKVETKKDSKEKCDPKACNHASGKGSCCAHDGAKKDEKKSEEKAPEKK
jgi:hypothetical protein